ncbi:MAG: hypothetical protein AAF500_02630 [Myxococcota bacterium]
MSTKAAFCLVATTMFVAGCSVKIPNGVFSCVSATDCPSGFFCWNSDGRCYDASEPELTCEPATCEQVISQFESLGVTVECGMLPDGCDGTVECPPCEEGDICGANDKNFMCGCEDNTCSSVEAQCGRIDVGCGSAEALDCGACPGALECVDNQCACTSGDCECPEGCDDGEICVEGACCVPLFPCSENECSPSGGLPDGCGGFVECPPCDSDEACTANPSIQAFECVGECTCESEGIECGTTNLCGTSLLCGICDTAGAPLCEDGRCVCKDQYEANDTPPSASELSCDGPCSAVDLRVDVDATLDRASDFDFYRIQLKHVEEYSMRVDIAGLDSERQLLMTYRCPDGSERIDDCSGSSSSFAGDDYCIEDGVDTLRLVHECENQNGGTGTLIVGVSAKEGEFRGPCDRYSISISTDYFDDDD